MWRELADLRKVERLRLKKKINELEEQINQHKKGIKNIKARIRRVKWEFSEPGPS
jgi:peptidoglycan hydrolase CwlO-like protein